MQTAHTHTCTHTQDKVPHSKVGKRINKCFFVDFTLTSECNTDRETTSCIKIKSNMSIYKLVFRMLTKLLTQRIEDELGEAEKA